VRFFWETSHPTLKLKAGNEQEIFISKAAMWLGIAMYQNRTFQNVDYCVNYYNTISMTR
jgi:hypothetical protein